MARASSGGAGIRCVLPVSWLTSCLPIIIQQVKAAQASLRQSHWKRPPRRPDHTWLTAIESDLRPLNIDHSYAWKKAASRELWRSIVDTATLKKSMPRREEKKGGANRASTQNDSPGGSTETGERSLMPFSWTRVTSIHRTSVMNCEFISFIVIFELCVTKSWCRA